MKKGGIFPLLLLLYSFLSAAQERFEGVGQYGKIELESLEGMGLLKLDGTKIKAGLKVQGSLIAKGANLGTLEVMGEANLQDTILREGGHLMGRLEAHGCKILRPLTLHSQMAVFTSSEVEAITVSADSGYKGKQVIELRKGTVVKEGIHFESGKGEVHLLEGSALLGALSGGKRVKK